MYKIHQEAKAFFLMQLMYQLQV